MKPEILATLVLFALAAHCWRPRPARSWTFPPGEFPRHWMN